MIQWLVLHIDLALIKLREVIDDVKSADVVTSVPTVNNGDKVSVLRVSRW